MAWGPATEPSGGRVWSEYSANPMNQSVVIEEGRLLQTANNAHSEKEETSEIDPGGRD